MPSIFNKEKPRIAILGANFAGLQAAKELKGYARVTVVDPKPFFEFIPGTPAIVSGVKSPGALRAGKQAFVEKCGHSLIPEKAAAVDPEAGTLTTASGKRVDFDALILACGSETRFFGTRGSREHAYPFKGVDHASAVRDRLARTLEKGPASVAIVGGGLAGVEILGEILRHYRNARDLTLHLVEGGDRLVAVSPEPLSRSLLKISADHFVNVHLKTRVNAVGPDRVTLDNGETLLSDLTVWSGGIKAPDLVFEMGLAPKKGAFAPVNHALQSERFANVFVAGDAAETPDRTAKQGYNAEAMGIMAAKNALRFTAGKKGETYTAPERPFLVSFGDLAAYMVYKDRVFTGAPAAALKEAVCEYEVAAFDLRNPGKKALGALHRFAEATEQLLLPALVSRDGAPAAEGLGILE